MIISARQILETSEKQRNVLLQTAELFSEIPRECKDVIKLPVPQFARVITGIRRCGKSTFVCQDLKNRVPDSFYLNFDDPSLVKFDSDSFIILDEAIKQFRQKYGNTGELFFDEIQSIHGWEVYINTKLKEGNLVTITGSNASLLSQELGTRLTGRHMDYEIFPFSFTEFCLFNKKEISSEVFSEYLEKGGFPEFLQYKQEQILTRLFDDILFRDIIVRYGIKDSRSVKILAVYLCSNCGNLVTGSKLSAQLGLKTTATILEYLSFLEQSYLFTLVPKFDYSAKAQSINPKKVYCIDTGLEKAVSISAGKNLGRLFENAVFQKIRSQTKNIWYYSESSFECDFLYGSSIVPEKAIQVCYELTNENMEREVKGLINTMKKFPNLEGKIVTLNQTDKISYGGQIIEVIDAKTFFGN